MKNSHVRLGVIGAGAICRDRHLPNLAKLEGVEVVAVCNRSRESSEAMAEQFSISEVESDWRQLIARDDLDGVIIGTWPYRHKEMAVAVLQAGKHCFCQARMAMNLPEAKQMLAAAQANPHLVNMICPPPTRMPYEPYIRHMIEIDQLGELTCVDLRVVDGSNLDTTRVHWREQVEYSGQQIMAVGIYAETLHAIVGPYASLTAHTAIPLATKINAEGQTVDIKVQQVVTITGRLENGALATEYHSGLATESDPPAHCLTLRGLKGTLRYTFGQTIEFAAAGHPLQPVTVPQHLQRDWRVEEDFIDAIRDKQQGEPSPTSGAISGGNPDFAEGLLYMQKMHAIHESAATGTMQMLGGESDN